MRTRHMLQKNDLPGDIEIHTDFLSHMPSALSRKRSEKVGKEPQEKMKDKEGAGKCILCNPNQKVKGTSQVEVVIENRVANFMNDYPYLPRDQRVVFLWHSEPEKRRRFLHKYRLEDIRKIELYWLLKGCIELGKKYSIPDTTYDLMRMVMGFNLGRLAGQSTPHFHAQYGWEVVLDRHAISEKEMQLYFEELKYSDLIIHESKKLKLTAPWTPKGQYALDLYFNDKFDILEMDEEDQKAFACIGYTAIRKYLDLKIQNLNIVFSNSPKDRKTEPLTIHFVPRVNMTALYEIKGVNVVDTPPLKIAEEFRVISWADVIDNSVNFDPGAEFDKELK